MRNPFKKRKSAVQPEPPSIKRNAEDRAEETSDRAIEAAEMDIPEDDSFTEYCRSQVHGGIERRERNDIFEEYTVYGADKDGSLICCRYHRYPEHEREFDLSYNRKLTAEEFNRRLLSELDRGDIKLADYQRCMMLVQKTKSSPDTALTDSDMTLLHDFCESLDTFTGQEYLHPEGIFSCGCESVVGAEPMQLRFRRSLAQDAFDTDIPGVSKKPIEGYDIENLWMMSLFNRVRENSKVVKAWLLSSEWSIRHESVHLFLTEDFAGLSGKVLIAAGDPSDMSRFGFWSLSFS